MERIEERYCCECDQNQSLKLPSEDHAMPLQKSLGAEEKAEADHGRHHAGNSFAARLSGDTEESKQSSWDVKALERVVEGGGRQKNGGDHKCKHLVGAGEAHDPPEKQHCHDECHAEHIAVQEERIDGGMREEDNLHNAEDGVVIAGGQGIVLQRVHGDEVPDTDLRGVKGVGNGWAEIGERDEGYDDHREYAGSELFEAPCGEKESEAENRIKLEGGGGSEKDGSEPPLVTEVEPDACRDAEPEKELDVAAFDREVDRPGKYQREDEEATRGRARKAIGGEALGKTNHDEGKDGADREQEAVEAEECNVATTVDGVIEGVHKDGRGGVVPGKAGRGEEVGGVAVEHAGQISVEVEEGVGHGDRVEAVDVPTSSEKQEGFGQREEPERAVD